MTKKSVVCLLIALAGCATGPRVGQSIHPDGELYLSQGIAAYREDEYTLAQSMFEAALAYYRGLDDASGVLFSAINLSETALAIGEVDRAAEYARLAEPLVGKADLTRYRDRIAVLMSSIAFREGDLERCAALLDPLVVEQREPVEGRSDSYDVWLAALASRTQLALVMQAPDREHWIARFASGLERSKADQVELEARLRRFRATLARDAGDFEGADARFRESLDLYREAGHRPGIAATLEEWGMLAVEQGRLPIAEDRLERALAVRLQTGNRPKSIAILRTLQSVQLRSGEDEQALRSETWIRRLVEEKPDDLAGLVEAMSLHEGTPHDATRAR